jgi:hypothetical protein
METRQLIIQRHGDVHEPTVDVILVIGDVRS